MSITNEKLVESIENRLKEEYGATMSKRLFWERHSKCETDQQRTNLHNEYFAQFVTDTKVSDVEKFIGKKAILDSKDKYFNDIPLMEWDNFATFWKGKCYALALSEGIDYNPPIAALSQSDYVCLAKACARKIRGW